MICVYPADCTDFSTNGNGMLAPLSAEVTETLNGEYELTLVHPIDEAGKWQRLVEGCIGTRHLIVSRLIERVEVRTGYKVHIIFKISLKQFLGQE